MRNAARVTDAPRFDDVHPHPRASFPPGSGARARWRRRLGRRLRLPLALVLVAGASGACESRVQRPSAGDAAVDTAAVKATIDSLRAAWEASVATGDLKSMGALLADGAMMVQPGGAAWDSMAAAAAGAPFPPGATIDITPIEVQVMSREWAYELGTSTVTYTPSGASEARKLNDTYLILFRNTAAGWKVYREVASSKPPPQARPPAP